MATAIIKHTRAKFQEGDRVQVNGRCPKYILDQIRHNRARTVVGVYYDPDQQCCNYTLGSNCWGNSMDYGWVYWFRSYQLQKLVKGRKAGRPRLARKYKKKELLLRPAVVKYFQHLGYIVEYEVQYNHYVDLVAKQGNEVIAIELKWSDWHTALEQAVDNKPYATTSYVALPKYSGTGADLDEFQKASIGLLRVDWKGGKVKVAIKATPSVECTVTSQNRAQRGLTPRQVYNHSGGVERA